MCSHYNAFGQYCSKVFSSPESQIKYPPLDTSFLLYFCSRQRLNTQEMLNNLVTSHMDIDGEEWGTQEGPGLPSSIPH